MKGPLFQLLRKSWEAGSVTWEPKILHSFNTGGAALKVLEECSLLKE